MTSTRPGKFWVGTHHRHSRDWGMARDVQEHGKDYIISMFMESIYLSRKYWRKLQLANLEKERTFPHLHCLEESRAHVYKSSTEYGRSNMADDMCQALGPVSEESVSKILEEKFHQQCYHTFMGPTLIAINPQTHKLSHKALTCSKGLSENLQLLVKNVVDDVTERKQSQSIIVSGGSGSGKTRTSMEILRHLYDQAGGGSATDAFKLISAALTALRPFDNTATQANQEASRSCWSVECAISSHAIVSSHITLHSLSHSRLTERPMTERCFDVFYMILSGMSRTEREQCHLVGYDDKNLMYLQNTYKKPVNTRKYQEKYSYWKNSLLTLGINHMDVLRLLSAVLLLGNFSFAEGDSAQLDVVGNTELQSVSTLLGVPVASLYQSLASRSLYSHRQYHRTTSSSAMANKSRHLLAQSLYGRLFQYLVRKINQTTESRASFLGSKRNTGSSASASDTNNIYVIDSLAFQQTQGTQLEQLCGNIGAEAIQHFYNTHTFHQLLDSYDDDGISIQNDVRWYDNSSTVQLLSQQHIGLVSLLYSECKEPQPRPRSLMRKLEKLHSNSVSLEIHRAQNLFAIQHYGGRVTYDCESLLVEDRNCISDDVISLFSKQSTHFTLLSKFYSKELKDIDLNGGVPRGAIYRAVPCQFRPYDTRQSSHSQDFLFSMDRLMETLACSNSTFVRCIKASPTSTAQHWDGEFVRRQLVMLEVGETVKLLTSGLPHKLSYKEFTSKYQCLTCVRRTKYSTTNNEYYQNRCQEIINQYLRIMEAKSISYSSANWVFGQKHLYLSDDASRQLDMVRSEVRYNAACKIQSAFRGWLIRQSWPAILGHMRMNKKGSRGAVSYDSGYNTPLSHKTSNTRLSSIANNSSYLDDSSHSDHLFQWKPTFRNMQERNAPCLPEKRKYSIQSGMKVYFPQIRVMKENVNVEGYELRENCEVMCIGYSNRASHVAIAFQNDILDVPFDKTSIRVCESNSHRPSMHYGSLSTN